MIAWLLCLLGAHDYGGWLINIDHTAKTITGTRACRTCPHQRTRCTTL
jgi:hypothetical protein